MGTVTATYLIHDAKGDLEKKAEGIALGLTIGSWTDLPLLEQKQLEKHKGTVLHVEKLEDDARVNTYIGKKMTRGIIKISYPSENFSNDLPAILTTTFGKLSLDGEVKLIDLEFSEDVLKRYPGPAFGIEGIRSKVNVYDRPLLMSIFKGVIGRDINYFKGQIRDQALGGVDLVKDDEILFENPLTPIEKRIPACKEVLDDVYEKTGHRTLYAVNLTGPTFELKDRAKRAVELGADLILFNVFAYGLDVLQGLREDTNINLPIMAHPAVSGALTPSEFYGFSNPLLLGKLLRYTGADLGLYPSPYGSVAIPREEALGIAHELVKEERAMKRAFPVPSAGIHPGLVPLLFNDFGMDSVVNAGGGVHGHPDGPVGGGKAFIQAIDAVIHNQPLLDAAKENMELKKAIELWGHQEVSK